ncbi:MAG: oligopeptide transport system substrate-binding protein [Bacillota bacterium]|nr:MAG: oligopeptide transport system substrate-binding protein [Bacillota bacterium]MBS3951283.1 peptide ABC transporter substrate-binding protein [Peptococcaceae bacterium]
MLKKLVVLFIMFALFIGTISPALPVKASTVPIKMVLNGKTLVSDVSPVIQNGRTLVPFRVIFEALGSTVEWDEKTNTVAGYKGPMFVLLQPGSTRAWITGEEVKLDVGPVIISGRTMVPLRFVAETMGAQVDWVDATNTVVITHTPDPVPTAQKSGDFTTVYSGELTHMNYLVTATSAEQVVAANTVDGLVEYNHLGVLYPSLAKSWKISNDGLVYTFNIRQGVNWMTFDNKVYAEVGAQDFVDALKYVLTKENASRTANIAYGVIKGAQEYFDGKTTDFSTVGVKAVDKYTVEYTLKAPAPYFMSMLTYVCFLPANGKFLAETGTRFGTDHKTLLNNGAYILKNFEPQNVREYVKNTHYWDANTVYINKLTYKFNREASQLAPELFFRGEITAASIPISVLDGWMQDPARKEMVRPAPTSTFTFWYAFNFDAKFPAQYEPENWKKAVNSLNFRKAIFHGIDRVAAMLTLDPYNPERQIQNTITPAGFVAVGGLDYTKLPALAKISTTNSYNRNLALDFRNKAQVELRAQGVTFPIKMMMPFNTGSIDWTNRVQVMEQQIENLLGKGFIDVIPVGFPATGFLDATRRAGNYAIQEVNWGPDYADPQTYTDPFLPSNTYSPLNVSAGYDGTYEKLIAAAKAEVRNVKKRYELFAQAEAYLIENAFVVPYRVGGGGYIASMLHPFTSAYAPFGVSNLKFKYQVVLDKPMNTTQFYEAQTQWQKDRDAALKRWGQ